jgi:hypothetical protein
MEVVEMADRVFLFRPLPGDTKTPPSLAIVNPLFRNLTAHDAEAMPEYGSLSEALATVTYRPNDGQREYNARIASALSQCGWNREARLLPPLGLRVDFERNGVWLEVEFGNARAYYQDYVKFVIAHRYRSAVCGILLCPTNPFANMLCELGKQRAMKRKAIEGKKRPSYSGMMTHEKAVRELPFLDFLLPGKVVIAGVNLSRLSAIK